MYVNSLTYREKKRYMNYAIISSCFGAVIQISLKESTLFIVYASSIGAGKFLSLATTSVIPLMTLVSLVPFAYIMEKKGLKNVLIPSYFFGMIGMLIAAAAGLFPALSIFLFTFGIVVFAVSIGAHSAGWFPLQRFIIPENERGSYFGRLRYSWQIVVSLFLLLAALSVQENAETGKLQIIILFGALLVIGRIFFVAKIPERPLKRRVPPLRVMLASAVSNRLLSAFSVYLFMTSFFVASAVPLGFAFLTFELRAADNILVLFSVFANLATILGFITASRITDKYDNSKLIFLVECVFGIIYILFIFMRTETAYSMYMVMLLILAATAAFSVFSVLATKRMMFLVKENNINISSALCFGLYSGGIGLSRLLSSLGIEYLPASTDVMNFHLSAYHILFLFFGAGIAFMLVMARKIGKHVWSD